MRLYTVNDIFPQRYRYSGRVLLDRRLQYSGVITIRRNNGSKSLPLNLCNFIAACLALLIITTARAEVVLEVEITGVEGAVLENVRAHLSIARHDSKAGLLPFRLPSVGDEKVGKPLTENELRRLHRRARREIGQSLQPYGYYESVIETRLEYLDETWVASYHIETGPATHIESVDIQVTGEGENEPAILAALEGGKLHAGNHLLHSEYDTTKQSLLRAALDAGYLDAGYSRAELRVTPTTRQARIELHLDTGPRYYFGPLTIQQDILDRDFIRQYIDFRSGEPFDTDKLLRLQVALGDSGYFNQVEVQTQRKEALDQHIPVIIKTTPAKPRLYAWGLGFGTDTGPRVSLGVVFRRVNERGHSILADARASKIARSVGLQYKVPVGNLVSDSLVFKAGADYEDVASEGKSNRYTLGANYNVEWGPVQRRLYVNYQHEDYSIGRDSEIARNLIPGISLSQLRTDNVLFPRRGYSWSVDLRGAAGVISDTRFLRTLATGRFVYPLGSKGRLLARTQLGASGVEEFSKLPASERFYAGGDQSVRGYGYQKLGPTDQSGDIVGGRYLVTGSLEMDYLFAGKFGGAVFIDAGNADDDFLPTLETGAGAGLRWRSPVGMLRLDVAHPFDRGSNDSFRIHVSIGPEL